MNINLDLSVFMRDLDKNCSKAQKKSFQKGELITSYIAKRNQLCLLLSRWGGFDSLRFKWKSYDCRTFFG